MPADAVERLSAIFERLGMEFEVEHVREALWLAQHNIDLSDFLPDAQPKLDKTVTKPEPARKLERPDTGRQRNAQTQPGKQPMQGGEAESKTGGVRIYPEGPIEAGGDTVKASPVALPAASALPGSLPIARALRPFALRWPSTQIFELDEDASVTATAEQGGQITAVMRPLQERWFEVNVVYEAAPSMLVWADTIHEFTALLQRTGLFRDVRQWRLELDGGPADQARVISPQGARLRAQILASPPRRSLILFATHGLSAQWRDGVYRRLLTFWARNASVAILQILPQHLWMRTELGEPSSFARAATPGAPASELLIEAPWWEFADEESKTTTFPLIALEPQTIHRWARAQMGKADRALAVALSAEASYVPEVQETAVEQNAETLVTYFRHSASPEACELAVYLSSRAFTLPVARLIQAAKFGSAAQQSHLAEVLMSGLLGVRGGPLTSAIDPNTVYYEFRPEAADILRRALRQEDAHFLASTLEQHVSAYLQAHLGRPISFRALIRDKNGNFDLPAWAQPFAELGAALLGLPTATPPIDKYDRFVAHAGEAVLRAAAVFAKAILKDTKRLGPSWAAEAGDLEGLEEPLWALLLEYRLISEPHLGLYAFAEGVLERLADSPYEREPGDPSDAYKRQRLSIYFACSHPELRPLRDQISAGLASRGFRMLQGMTLQMSHLIQSADTYLQIERQPGTEVLGEALAIAQDHGIRTRMVYTEPTGYEAGFNVDVSNIEETIQHMFLVISDHARHDPGPLVGVPARSNRAAPLHPGVGALQDIFYSSGREVAAVFSSDGFDARSLVIDFVHKQRQVYGVSWGDVDGRWPLHVYDGELPSDIQNRRRAILLDPHPDLFLEDEHFPSYDGPPLDDGGSRYIASLRRALSRYRGIESK